MSNLNALVIIGNGFDLQLNLDSSYQKFYDHLEGIKHANMWPSLIYYNKSTDNLLWQDIEYAILNFLIGTEDNKLNFKNIISPNIPGQHNYISQLLIGLRRKLIPSTLEFIHNPKDNINENTLNSIYSNILSQVRDLEKLFGDYMKEQVSNVDYNSRSIALLKEIITANDTDKIKDFSELKILNFNYTSILNSEVLKIDETTFKERNIHGTLSSVTDNDDINIIFGIDSTRFNIQDKPSLYQFTKTFRVMNNNIKSNLSKQIKIPQELNYIYFYGHSLGEQDYSYFQSIFDTIDLYYSKTILRFIFSDNFLEFPEDKHNHKLNTSSQVAKLIEIYGESFGQEKLRGKNLLHKLIVENRLEIILLNPESTTSNK